VDRFCPRSVPPPGFTPASVVALEVVADGRTAAVSAAPVRRRERAVGRTPPRRRPRPHRPPGDRSGASRDRLCDCPDAQTTESTLGVERDEEAEQGVQHPKQPGQLADAAVPVVQLAVQGDEERRVPDEDIQAALSGAGLLYIGSEPIGARDPLLAVEAGDVDAHRGQRARSAVHAGARRGGRALHRKPTPTWGTATPRGERLSR
jgi:hypothetical protein